MRNRMVKQAVAVGSLLLMAATLGGCIFVPYRPYYGYRAPVVVAPGYGYYR